MLFLLGADGGAPDISLFPVAFRVFLLPVPGIPAHIRQSLLSGPAEDLLALGRVSVAGGDVTGPAAYDLVGHIYVVDLHKGVHGIHDTVADAGAQVEDLGALVLGGELYGGYVALGQV